MRDLILSNSKADNVGLLLPSTGWFAASYFGCLWAGKTSVPLNFLLTPHEMQAVVTDAGLDLILSITQPKPQTPAGAHRVIYLDSLSLKARTIWRRVRGPIVMKGYHRRPDLTRAALDTEGWLYTGDIGVIDDEGFLTISGRKKEIIIIGGENVFPAEIERVLEMPPGRRTRGGDRPGGPDARRDTGRLRGAA